MSADTPTVQNLRNKDDAGTEPGQLLDRERIARTLGTRDRALTADFLLNYQTYAAGEIAALLAERGGVDRGQLREQAHRLKSSSYSMGVTRLADALSALEALCMQQGSDEGAINAAIDEVEHLWQLSDAAISRELNEDDSEAPIA